jgi:hypothetical protein
MRGRGGGGGGGGGGGSGGRRGPNPLTRSYESNGPDVKVRGTAQQIGERYLQLARDAQSSGDPVTAESYLQHAEHYFRLIAAAQEQMQQQFGYRPRQEEADEEAFDEEDQTFGHQQPRMVDLGSAPQPPVRGEGFPAREGGFNGRPGNAPREEREGREGGAPREEREGGRFGRPGRGERFGRGQPRFGQGEPQPPAQQPQPVVSAEPEPALPSFITAPTRVAPPPAPVEESGAEAAEASGDEGARFPRRRRRGRKPAGEAAGAEEQGEPISE